MANLKAVEKLSAQQRIALKIDNMADSDDPVPILELMLATTDLSTSDIGLLLKSLKTKTGRTVGDLKKEYFALQQKRMTENYLARQNQDTGYTYPKNWFYADSWLQHIVEPGHSTPYTKEIYPGDIRVVGVEENVHTGEYFLKITFPVGNGQKTVTVPLAEISTRNGVIKWLSAQGATISEIDAPDLAKYIVLSYAINRCNLKSIAFSEKFGNCQGGLITPMRSVCTPVEYRGKQAVATGYNLNALKNAFEEIATWDTWVPWLTMGAALFSPFTERLSKLQRNPIFCLTGGSGFGKSTVIHWGMSVWGNPTMPPLKLESTTQVAFSETVKHLGSLPIYLDEIHTVKGPALERIFYSFANKTTRVTGTKDYSGTRGGESIFGVMLTSGEHVPSLENEGAYNRLMIIPMDTYLPLGAESRTLLGNERARKLENLIPKINGLLGPLVWEQMHTRWDAIEKEILKIMDSSEYENLGTIWAMVLAGIMQAIWSAMSAIQFIPDKKLIGQIKGIIPALSAIVDESRKGVGNPADEAWHRLLGMLAACRKSTTNSLELDEFMSGPDTVAWISMGRDGKQIVVPTDTQPFKQAMSLDRGVTRYGRHWLKMGYIIPSAEGGPTTSRKPPNGLGSIRCLIIPFENEKGI